MTHKVEKTGEKMKKSVSKSNLTKEEKEELKEQKKREKKEKKLGIGSSATLPNRSNASDFDMDSAYNSGFGSKNSAFQRVGSGRNRDPGVQSDEEEDDDFKVSKKEPNSGAATLQCGVDNLVRTRKVS